MFDKIFYIINAVLEIFQSNFGSKDFTPKNIRKSFKAKKPGTRFSQKTYEEEEKEKSK